MRLRTGLPSIPGPLGQLVAPRPSLAVHSPPQHRILHIIGAVHPKAGGPSTVVTRLAAAQAALGNEVTILSFLAPRSRAIFATSVAKIPGFDRVNLELNPTAHSTLWLAQPDNRRRIQSLIKRADIVHLHGVWEPLLLLAARVSRKCGVPYIVRPCGMLDPWSLKQHGTRKALALVAGYRWMLNNASCLHVLNTDERRLIERLGLTCRKTIIPNGVFLEELYPLPAKGTFHSAHPELRGKPYVLFLSRLHQKKGLEYLVEAFRSVAEKTGAHLVIAGPDDGAGLAVKNLVAQYGLAGRVHLVGALYGAEKLAALADAAVFCLPSRQEGFSLAASEALACGVPVVLSEACHFPEVAQAEAGRVVKLSAESIAAALLEILSDSVVATAMGKAGRHLMETRFTWPAVAQRCEAMYATATRAPRRAEDWRTLARRITVPMMQLGRFAYHLF